MEPDRARPRTVLICHEEDAIDREGLARWLGSFSHVVGLVVIRELPARARQRIRREIRRVGPLRFLDVVAFRLWYRFALAGRDAAWRRRTVRELQARYAPLPAEVPVHLTHSPNARETESFLREAAPDIVLARCKFILRPSVFSIPRRGTLVLHPGICPEYRNAHGCFWALAGDDLDRVGVTLLRIDEGIDTGPVLAYFTVPYDERRESHIVIQYRALLDNLDAVAAKFLEVHEGTALAIDTAGRASREWGQPWLTKYLRWRWRARVRARGHLARPV